MLIKIRRAISAKLLRPRGPQHEKFLILPHLPRTNFTFYKPHPRKILPSLIGEVKSTDSKQDYSK